MPSADRVSDSTISSGISFNTISGVSETPSSGASASIMSPWAMATPPPPTTLPSTTPVRLKGATSTSFKKPNSLSQTTDMPENMDVISTVMAIMPGYINWMKSTPGVSEPMIRLKPAPKITRKSRGMAKDDNSRERS